MNIAHVDRAADRIIELNPRLWAWAMLLGEARTASNDHQRHRRSDRGGFNSRVDLLGALGELILLRTVMAAASNEAALSYMRDHLYREQGGQGVTGPDLRFDDDVTGIVQQIDVKTFDCSPNKKFFAINANKHQSLRGQCSAYFCLLTPPFGRWAATSKLVPYADVDKWPSASLRLDGSASRNWPLPDFLTTYFSSPPKVSDARTSTFVRGEIQAAMDAGPIRSALAEMVPSLRDKINTGKP